MNNVIKENVIKDIKVFFNYKNALDRRTLVRPQHLLNLIKFLLDNKKQTKFVEIGVGKGGLIALIKKYVPNTEIIGMDSWEGMPEISKYDNQKFKKYNNFKLANINDVYDTFRMIGASTDNINLIQGYIEYTIPHNLHFLKNIDILRLDVDWYKATLFALQNLYKYVNNGGLIIIDDYNWNIGCKKAVDKFRLDNNITNKIIKDIGTIIYWYK